MGIGEGFLTNHITILGPFVDWHALNFVGGKVFSLKKS